MKERFETFTILINRINRNIRKIENQEMSEYNLRSAHISCLFHLYSATELTATELCEKCEEDKATISRAITYLEKHGYLTCESKFAKRYKSPLALTEKGNEAAKRIHSAVDRVLDEVGVGLTDEQRRDFYGYLSIICDNLDKITDNLS